MWHVKLSMAAFLLLLLFFRDANAAGVVSFDRRSIVIDGQRRILISGSVHYPRATPQMWPGLIDKAKAGGIDTIDTYVFWNGHEPSQGSYNFEGRYNLTGFLKLVQEAGLFAILRIGPYVCAEWNFGGLPAWLLKVPGMRFRTDNEPFKNAMEGFVRKTVGLVKEGSLFASQGGPVVLAQIENEYGNVQGSYGASGKKYMLWAANLARELNVGVPWVMCQQSDAPSYVINTCNGYYCDGWKPNSPDKPKIWTENWIGWFQSWGEPVPYRPIEDVAFAVARFFQRGGVMQNYYMYFGGTNFGRTSGGPYITTSYDYDSPIDEFGQLRQPKWGHLRELHAALKLCEQALTSNEPRYMTLGRMQEAHVYAEDASANVSRPCAAFLANIDARFTAKVQFYGKTFELPPWSVSILPDCRNVVFNTAKVTVQATVMKMTEVVTPPILKWEWFAEPIGVSGSNVMRSGRPLEQISVTNDTTDYMWYTTRFEITDADSAEAEPILSIARMRDMIHVFVNGDLAGRANTLATSSLSSAVALPIKLKEGLNELSILSETIGLQNYGALFDTWGAGIDGSVLLHLATGTKDLTLQLWLHEAGLKGERHCLHVQNDIEWSTLGLPSNQPLVWYKALFDLPVGDDPVAIDLGSMGKGRAWINGKSIGRYWPVVLAHSQGCSKKCDYRGAYTSSKCYTGCGEPSQRWYHIPRDWMKLSGNTLVLFEELGGDVSSVSLATRSVESVCADVSEYDLPPVDSNSSLPLLELKCGPGQIISSISFASFGNPRGSCGKGWTRGGCHADESSNIVQQACLWKHGCAIGIHWTHFGKDPCPGKWKHLAVEALCAPPLFSSDSLTATM